MSLLKNILVKKQNALVDIILQQREENRRKNVVEEERDPELTKLIQEQQESDLKKNPNQVKDDQPRAFKLFGKLDQIRKNNAFFETVKLAAKMKKLKESVLASSRLVQEEEDDDDYNKISKKNAKRFNIISEASTKDGKFKEGFHIFGDKFFDIRQELNNIGARHSLTHRKYSTLQDIASKRIFSLMRKGKKQKTLKKSLKRIFQQFLTRQKRTSKAIRDKRRGTLFQEVDQGDMSVIQFYKQKRLKNVKAFISQKIEKRKPRERLQALSNNAYIKKKSMFQEALDKTLKEEVFMDFKFGAQSQRDPRMNMPQCYWDHEYLEGVKKEHFFTFIRKKHISDEESDSKSEISKNESKNNKSKKRSLKRKSKSQVNIKSLKKRRNTSVTEKSLPKCAKSLLSYTEIVNARKHSVMMLSQKEKLTKLKQQLSQVSKIDFQSLKKPVVQKETKGRGYIRAKTVQNFKNQKVQETPSKNGKVLETPSKNGKVLKKPLEKDNKPYQEVQNNRSLTKKHVIFKNISKTPLKVQNNKIIRCKSNINLRSQNVPLKLRKP